MPGVFFRKLFAGKNMSKMSAAIGAYDFRTATVCIGYPLYGVPDFIVKAWPSTVRLKFVYRAVQGGVAAPANISTVGLVV